MTEFKIINGQLCRMVEPEPLQLDSPMPCVVRYIQDDSPMGRYLKRKHDMVINTIIEVNRIGSDNRVYNADKTFIEEIECLEIIGYPVVEGSHYWALYQIRSGNKVAKDGYGERYGNSFYENRLFYLNGSGCLVTKNGIGLIDTCSEEEFLGLDETGWEIYKEPKPEPAKEQVFPEGCGYIDESISKPPKEPYYVICKRCGGSQSVTNPAVSNTAYITCPKCGGTGYEIDEQKLPKEQKIDSVGKEYTCLICRKKMSELDGRAEVSIKRISISNLYESTLSHYCGSCFLKLGFDATEKELRSRQQPIAEPKPEPEPEPTYKAGDWVEVRGRGRTIHGKCISTEGRVSEPSNMILACGYLFNPDGTDAKYRCKTHGYIITRKLKPSEVEVDFGFAKGRILSRTSGDVRVLNNKSVVIATIIVSEITNQATRNLVENILKAQEEK